MNTTGIQYSTRRHRRLTLPGPEGAIFQQHPPAQLRRRRRPRAWLRGGLAAPGVPGGAGPGAAAGCAAATAAAVALTPHPAAPSRRRGLPGPQPGRALAARGGRAGGRRGGSGSPRPAPAASPARPRRPRPARGRSGAPTAARRLRGPWGPVHPGGGPAGGGRRRSGRRGGPRVRQPGSGSGHPARRDARGGGDRADPELAFGGWDPSPPRRG